ncbi:MAG: lysozyme [Agriterribacter sp.]
MAKSKKPISGNKKQTTAKKMKKQQADVTLSGVRAITVTSEIQHLSKSGLEFIGREEGCILKPYLDSVGIPTIGYGNTYYENGVRVKMSDPPISKDRALSLFLNILGFYEKAVWSNTRNDINQNQFNALVSLTYNIGINAFKNSTVLKLVNKNPFDPKITDAFKMWKNAGGRPILLKRRIREANLYFS